MAVVFKCKECDGDIQPLENGLGKCLYCGALQTLPKDNDERIAQILIRANDFRRSCDFDRAIFEYEKVLELDGTEPEAHWGIFLSKYGIEYVPDGYSKRYKLTLHRITSTSVFDDVDYQATLKYAAPNTAFKYKEDAALIENLMKELLLISNNQEPYDIFLSYKRLDNDTEQPTVDSYLAHELYNELTGLGYKVFFAPKSLVGDGLWEPKIYSAIISTKAMIVLGTRPQYFNGVWVKNEWSRFAELVEHGEDKVLIPVYKNMPADKIPNRLTKYQVYDMDSLSFLDDVKKVIAQTVKKKNHVSFDNNASAEAIFLERGFLALEDGNFSKADSYFEKTLDTNPHNSQAYFGKLMVEMRNTNPSQILISPKYLNEYANFEKAVRFADHQLKVTLLKYEEKVKYTLDEQKYNKAVAIISKPKLSENDYLEAIEILHSIVGFKDADKLLVKCQGKIDAIHLERKRKADKDRIERERQAEEDRQAAEARARKRKKFVMIVVSVIAITLVFSIVLTTIIIPSTIYNNGLILMNNGDYAQAISTFEQIYGYKDSSEKVTECRYNNAKALMNNGNLHEAFSYFSAVSDFNDSKNYLAEILKEIKVEEKVISAGLTHTVGINSDGTVIAVGDNESGQCNVGNWFNIVAVSTGIEHTVGLKSDGTVVAVGDNEDGQCDVSNWTDVVAISVGSFHTIGLKSDGTVVAVGSNSLNQCDVSSWTDIVSVSAGAFHTIGLKSDGTVVAVGDNEHGQCDVSNWTDIVSVSAGDMHAVGLKSDGTVVAIGNNDKGECDVEDWNSIISISATDCQTVGLKSDGTVMVIGSKSGYQPDVSNWTDIVAISAGILHTVGLKSDGTVVSTCFPGNEAYCNVSDWTNIKLPNS